MSVLVAQETRGDLEERGSLLEVADADDDGVEQSARQIHAQPPWFLCESARTYRRGFDNVDFFVDAAGGQSGC